jgi:ubiquinone biosynthesis protein
VAIYEPTAIVDEFERSLFREMDFVNEAATITRFSEVFGEDPHFRAPTVHWDLTGPNVLTLEELHGISTQTLLRTANSEIDRTLLAHRLANAFMRQFFETGLFHADPHPGNLLVRPPAEIGLIDFGITGHIDDEMLGQITLALVGAFNREPDIVVEILADMNALSDKTDRHQLKRDFAQLIDKYYGLPLRRFGLQTLFFEITGLIRRNQVTLPREFVLFGKALVGVGGICLQLDPELDLLELVKPKLRGLLARRLSPGNVLKSATMSGWHVLNILRSAPGQIRDISRRLARGQWQVNIRHQNLETLGTEIDKASNRLGVSVIIGSIILGSSWVLTSSGTDAVQNIPLAWLGIAGYLVAGVMGLWLVIAIIRSGKLS